MSASGGRDGAGLGGRAEGSESGATSRGGVTSASSGGATTTGGVTSNSGTTSNGGAQTTGGGPSGGFVSNGGNAGGGAGGTVASSSGGGAGLSGGTATGGAVGAAGKSSGGGAAGASTGGINAGGSGGGAAGDDRCGIAKQGAAGAPQALTLSGNLGTHDPALIFAHGQYYLYQTGDGIGAKTSSNLREWKATPVVFNSNPGWVAQQVPGATNLWAPDISYFGGSYHLYYSASTFGSNRSCIGHATRAALNSGSWTDHGSVICSNPGGGSKDDWNAIDPNVIVDQAGVPWLAFGSFWGGIKMVQLDATGARANSTLNSVAARPSNGGALEAPFIVRRCGYYYLFVSFDTCCKGVDSTYKVMVGRSTAVTGPYSDRAGKAMMQGGGTLVVASSTRWRGPGHNAVVFSDTAAYNVYHSYDADNGGNATLRVSELVWDAEGWPVSGGP